MSLLRTLIALVMATALLLGCGSGGDEPAEREAGASKAPSQDSGSDRDRGAPGDANRPDTDELESLAKEAEEEAVKASKARRPLLGADAGWPQCRKGLGIPERPTQGQPMPLPEARYVILGLTNGPGFTRNPCLPWQVRWVRERGMLLGAYAVVSYPSAAQLRKHRDDGPYAGGTRIGALRNVGYAQSRANLTTMKRAKLKVPAVWLDVEPVTIWEWSPDRLANAAVVEGAARAYRDAGYRIGVYSTAHLWELIVGGFRLGVPEWRAAGETSRAEALRRCGRDHSIQGGRPILSQWVALDRDQNVTCPGVDARPWLAKP
ncbi:hypothetical protein [Nocardioides sp. zg-DK7169]|uniref:hypothetical protein n=1 Tax=Nocardioides sp. zg-DK7169 TaxID=2736600 RepID=UPI0015521A1F|nr:hypothetical protein [Nocardioides sp. zg-DK7169]NPC96871.1 hypothetical protein [Nocardioides sp. zg-DK7169]